MKKFYITNAIPYVNAKPHVGHALEFVQADVIARYHKIVGEKVLQLCGGDENAIKNVAAAEKEHIPIQEFVDKNTRLFYELAKKLQVNYDVFQKGSDKNHYTASQKLWKLCEKSGDIYKKSYSGLYCVGCELFYEKDELDENGECFEHPGKKLETVTEENYFFKLSKYEKQLTELIEKDELLIIPQVRKNEALSFIKQGLKDISISRSNVRAKNWGVPVPGDNSQRIYVWFDALNIYQSGIGFESNEKMYKKWWPADVQVIGKGILRFHAIYFPAFLLSAGLKTAKSLFVHGYFTVNGQKMSKTLGNVIDPLDIIAKFGSDGLRYYLLKEIPSTEDGDFSKEKLQAVYNADLANGLGNLIARVAKLCENSGFALKKIIKNVSLDTIDDEFSTALHEYRFNDALSIIWGKIKDTDKFINQEKPWELLEVGNQNRDVSGKKLEVRSEKLHAVLTHAVEEIQKIAILLEPFLPETALKIEEQFKGSKITSQKSLFPRIT